MGYLCELSPEISCVLYIGLMLWDFIHSRHNSVLREFILWDQILSKGLFCEKF